MNDKLPNFVPNESNFHRAWNKLMDWCRRNSLQSSDDILVIQNTHGTSLKFARKQQGGTAGMNWKGTYNETASYSVNDVVYVDFHSSYSVPFTVSTGSAFPALSAGIYICVNSVPASASRNSYNYYYPIDPQIPSSSVVTVSGSLANQTFWQPITPLVEMKTCVSGQNTKTQWICAFSADTFDLSQLPYSGSGS